MKTKYALAFVFGALALGTIAAVEHPSASSLVVHEWGTFTSVQGGDGNLLSWRPLVSSELPPFVYNWQHAGFDRVTFNPNYANKGSMSTLQRMETPVVYFYSDDAQTVDLSVEFPKGLITEWYPQASQIGPSKIRPATNSAAIDPGLELSGYGSILSPSMVANEHIAAKSMIHWPDIHIVPIASTESVSADLPADSSGSHYFAARETDANLIRLDSLSPTSDSPEYEKFLFYRGAGSFATPLRVTMKSDDAVTVTNSGKETLKHLFVLGVKDKSGGFVYVTELLPGEEKTIPVSQTKDYLSPAELNNQLAAQMSSALTSEGLYPREAVAMVNTWKNSWFTESGLRVLYVLPRPSADRTLPMSLSPSPKELVRVMVGRAEVLTPALENELAQQLEKARSGDANAAAQVREIVKALGRFAQPAFYRALAKIKAPFSDEAQLATLLSSK